MTWEEQFMAMKRWFYRLQGINGGQHNAFSSSDTYQSDFFQAFFISSYHFKDALINANVSDVENLINKNLSLKLAGDVANFTKHTKLTSTRTGDLQTKGFGKLLLKQPENAPSYIVSILHIESNGESYNAFSIAEDCMNIWGNFLLSRSLQIPELIEENIYLNFPKWAPKSREGLK